MPGGVDTCHAVETRGRGSVCILRPGPWRDTMLRTYRPALSLHYPDDTAKIDTVCSCQGPSSTAQSHSRPSTYHVPVPKRHLKNAPKNPIPWTYGLKERIAAIQTRLVPKMSSARCDSAVSRGVCTQRVVDSGAGRPKHLSLRNSLGRGSE